MSTKVERGASRPGAGSRLVIVESPTKAKTIRGFLPPGYEVAASMGHVRDMPKEGLNIDIENNFKPTYEIIDARRKVISDLRAAAKTTPDIVLQPRAGLETAQRWQAEP